MVIREEPENNVNKPAVIGQKVGIKKGKFKHIES
jgi:hypothetical protein